MDSKIFNDPIHGHIELHPLCMRVIDTPQFQRLRYLKQLGACYFVFPGASHNRFEHSLGVSYLAGELVELLRSKQPELGITVEDVLCVKIAGLCHDLGHGPFSHLFDSRFIPVVRPGSKWKHEVASVMMFNHLINENNLLPEFKKYNLGERDISFIEEQIAGPKQYNIHEEWPYKGRDSSKSFLYEIVANKRNSVDVDKWDYFARDCHQLGIRSNFDHMRFMKFARVIAVENELQICTRDKEVGNLYDMFQTRMVLHRRAYQHKTTVIFEHMIAEALTLADNHIHFLGRNGKRLKMSETIDDMFAYTQLEDSIFLRILYSSEPELEPARKILQDIQSRRLYKFIGQTKLKPGAEDKDWVTLICNEMSQQSFEQPMSPSKLMTYVPLSPKSIVVLIAKFDYGMADSNPIDHVRFYSKSDPQVAIQVRKNQVSEMLPDTFSEKTFRVYCKCIEADAIATAKAVFPIVCHKLSLQPPKSGEPGAADLTPVKSSRSSPQPAKRPRHDLGASL